MGSTTFSGPVTATGGVVADITGDVTGDITGDITGDVTGDVTGNITGNTAGIHTGAVTGNVTGNTAGVHTGAVTGNVTGNVAGNIVTSSLNVGSGGVLTKVTKGDLTVTVTTLTQDTEADAEYTVANAVTTDTVFVTPLEAAAETGLTWYAWCSQNGKIKIRTGNRDAA